MNFQGSTYEPVHDEERLSKQWHRVFLLMRDGRARSLREIAQETGDPEASISARLRDLRRMGYTVNRKRREPKSAGIFEYQVLVVQFDGSQGLLRMA